VSLVCILALLLMERAGLVSIIGSNIICKSKSKMTLFYRALCMLAFTPNASVSAFFWCFDGSLRIDLS
jgi:hypothetical protein